MENGGSTVMSDEAVKDFSKRSVSLNIQNEDGSPVYLEDDEAEEVKSNVKISFHLSLDQGGQTESRTKKFLESDDAIISQIFSQTITSAGVTPTDEYEEFFAAPAKKQQLESGEDEEDKSEATDDESQRLQILNTQQRPSIVIDCFDETPPVTPDEPTPGTGAFYFHQTIVDDDDVTLDPEVVEGEGAESGVEEGDDVVDEEIPSELLEAVQQYGLSDNFTTIEEDTDEILSPAEEKTEMKEEEEKNEEQEENDENKNSSAVPFLSNNQLVEPEPEPALQSDNLVDVEDGWRHSCVDGEQCEVDDDNELDVDVESEDDDDDSAENNITAKAFSFDDEQTASVETASEEAYEESTEIEIDEFGNEKVSTKSNRTASASMKTKASVEQKANGVSTKTSIEESEERSVAEESTSQGVNMALTGGSPTLAIKAGGGGGDEPEKKKKVIRKKAKKGDGDTGKENISVHSSIMKFNKICNANKSLSSTTTTTTVNAAATTNGNTSGPKPITNGKSNGVVVVKSTSSNSINNSSLSSIQSKPTAAVSPSPKVTTQQNGSNGGGGSNGGQGYYTRPATSYYHTFNCSRDMMRKRNVQNYLNRNGDDATSQIPHNTIYELRNTFEQIIGGSKVSNGKILSNGTNKDNSSRIKSSNGSTLVKTENNYTTATAATTTTTNSNNQVHSHNYKNNNSISNNSNNNNNNSSSGNHHHHNLTAFNNHISAIKGSRPDIYLTVGRKKVMSLTYGDDLSNIDVKRLSKSFSKFDALQKSNSKANVNGKLAQKKTRKSANNEMSVDEKNKSSNGKLIKMKATPQPVDNNCRACGKVVFQMEQMKAERNVWHKNCFRCEECNKQLNVDTYQSHESKLYCKPHFKSLFSPKVVEDSEPVSPKKPQLIIAENQPVELPPDVVRASDKPDLGLDELQQLNVKQRFEVFEKGHADEHKEIDRSPGGGVKKSTSILSKLARFQTKEMNSGVDNNEIDGGALVDLSGEEDDPTSESHEEVLEASRRVQKERPVTCANMEDIKTRFESGKHESREERREEQKKELQTIRSRLFMGKQAKIKEMYQQAVAESEQMITAAGKLDVDLDLEKARSIKEKFEKGVFGDTDDEDKSRVPDDEMAVFEQGISKQSRSIFQELDANVSKQPQSLPSPVVSNQKILDKKRQYEQQVSNSEVIRSGEKLEDVHIETADISNKFKFFESYRPEEAKKKEFRITPPREGVVKMPTPEKKEETNGTNGKHHPADDIDDSEVAAKTHTASKMLSFFRQMETNKHQQQDAGPKPLKRFTPPLDENSRVYKDDSGPEEYSDEELGEEEYEEDEEDGEDIERVTMKNEEEYIKAAKEAARAKLIREKFEQWEKKLIESEKHEQNNSSVNLYEENIDESQVESARSIKAKFEAMQTTKTTVQKEPIKVNRFV